MKTDNTQKGTIKRDGNNVIFAYNGENYVLGDHPYEPCTYIKKDGKIIRTLHNAFTVYDLPEFFAEGRVLTAVDGRKYDEEGFCRVLCAAVDSQRSEMDFPFAANLVKTEL